MGHWSRHAPAPELLAHLCSTSPSTMASALWSCWELKLGAPPDGAPFLLFSPDFDGDTAQYVQIVHFVEKPVACDRYEVRYLNDVYSV